MEFDFPDENTALTEEPPGQLYFSLLTRNEKLISFLFLFAHVKTVRL